MRASGVYNNPPVTNFIAGAGIGSTDDVWFVYWDTASNKFALHQGYSSYFRQGNVPGNSAKQWSIGCSDKPYNASYNYNISFK